MRGPPQVKFASPAHGMLQDEVGSSSAVAWILKSQTIKAFINGIAQYMKDSGRTTLCCEFCPGEVERDWEVRTRTEFCAK